MSKKENEPSKLDKFYTSVAYNTYGKHIELVFKNNEEGMRKSIMVRDLAYLEHLFVMISEVIEEIKQDEAR